MLPWSLWQKCKIFSDPLFGGFFTTWRTESGFTGMEDFFGVPTCLTGVMMKAEKSCAAS